MRPDSADQVSADQLAEVAARAGVDAGGLDPDLLGDFLATLTAAVAEATPLTARTLRAYRGIGERAAREGIALRALLDLYLSGIWRLWRHLPDVTHGNARADRVITAGEIMLRAADDVVAALTEGYQLARRDVIRSQESSRREFIDDLLAGSGDVAGVVERAERFGLDLSGPHAVAVLVADRPFDDAHPLVRRMGRAIAGVKGDAHPLLASKAGRLVVVFAAPDAAAVGWVSERLAASAHAAAGDAGRWRLALGRPGTGASGVATSYREAQDAIDLADRLALDGTVIDSRDLLAYQVLLRDRGVLLELVRSRLGPLVDARGGARPLLDTLEAYFRHGGNAAAGARSLHLSVRAMTYRLERIRDLTGLSVDRAEDRFTLQVAVLGARLLNWPTG